MATWITPSNLQYAMLSAGGFGPNSFAWVVDLITDITLSNVDLLSDLSIATFPGYAQQPTGSSGSVVPDISLPFYRCDLYPVTFLCTADDVPLQLAASGYAVSDYSGNLVWAELWDPTRWVYGATLGEEWILALSQIAYWSYP